MSKTARRTPRVGLVSLGCPKAGSDAEDILTRLHARGHQLAAGDERADLTIVNTCGFIDAAAEESLDAIAAAIADSEAVIVAGCLGARADMVRERFPDLLAIIGPHAPEAVLAAAESWLGAAAQQRDDTPAQGLRLTPPHYAWLKIAEGCNHHCSFCIIPALRGPLVSRPIGDIMREAQTLVAAGVREIILIAQDTPAYGRDRQHRTDFIDGRPIKTRLPELCRELGELGVWVRLHYVYPYPNVDELLPLMASGKLLPYLDVPLQHASHRILKLMQRPGDSERMLERIAAWRAAVPDLTVRSTFITGFPGESEAEFNELLDFLDAAQLDRVGAFAYSPVNGAAANALPGALPEGVREDRKLRLLQHQEDISTQRLEARIGRRMRVIVDDVDADGAIARSAGDAPDIDGLVLVNDGQHLAVGDFADVQIIDCDVHDLYARMDATP